MKKIYPELVEELRPLVAQHIALKERCLEVQKRMESDKGHLTKEEDERLLQELKPQKLQLKDRMARLVARYHPADAARIDPHLYIMSTPELKKLRSQSVSKSGRMTDRGTAFIADATRYFASACDVQAEMDRRIGLVSSNETVPAEQTVRTEDSRQAAMG